MSLLIRRAPACSMEFLTRPNTYSLKLPTGSDFYFSIPFNMDWLNPLRPIELASLHDYLSAILNDVTDRIGQIGMYSVLDVQHEISTRLSSADQLTEIENATWAAGHGFPVFDVFHKLTTFSWDWNAIHFECGPSVVAWYTRQLYDFQHKPGFEKYAVRRSMRFEESNIGYHWWVEDGQFIIKWYCNGKMVCIKTYGAAFRDLDEWRALKTQLESYELDMLNKGTARLCNAQNGGWELVVYSHEGWTGTTSDTSSFECACEPYTPVTNPYLHQSHVSDERTVSNPNSWDPCGYRQHTAEYIQTLDTRTSQTSPSSYPEPPNPSELLHQANTLAKTVRDLEARLFHLDKTQPSPRISPKSLAYPKPCLDQAVPPAPRLLAQTAVFPVTIIREDLTLSPPQYQAYAEDDNDDGTEESVRAAPNSWRDV